MERRRVPRIVITAFSALMSTGLVAQSNLPPPLRWPAQNNQKVIDVVVTDPQGAIAENAKVRLKNDRGYLLASGVTNRDGFLELIGSWPELILLEAYVPGFYLYREVVKTTAGEPTGALVRLEVPPACPNPYVDQNPETRVRAPGSESPSYQANRAQCNSQTKAASVTPLTSEIALVVTDFSGVTVPNSSVILTGESGNAPMLGKADQCGRLQMSGLPPGSYEIDAWAQGFKTGEEMVIGEAGRTTDVQIKLVMATSWICVSPPGGWTNVVQLESYPVTETKIDSIPYTPLPRPNFFRRFLGWLF